MVREASNTTDLDRILKRAAREARGGKNCPNCKGKGHTLRKKFMGNNSYDEPEYFDEIIPCTTCRYTVTKIRKKYA